jgi:O-antigen/teichoic acid export membrane protein
MRLSASRLGRRLFDRTGLPQSVRYNVAVQYAATLGVAVAGGIYTLGLGRVLGAHDFGRYALSLSVATLLFGALDFRMQEATVRFAIAELEHGRAAAAVAAVRFLFRCDVIVRSCALALAVLLSGTLERTLIREPGAAPAIIWAAIALFAARCGNAPAIGLLRLTDNFGLQGRLSVMAWVFRLAATAAYVIYTSPTVSGVLAISAAVGGVFNAFGVSYAIRAFRRYREACTSDPHATTTVSRAAIVRFLVSSNAISLSDLAVREGDTTIVGWFLPLESVAVYRMTKNIVMMVWSAADPLFVVAMPEFTRLVTRALLTDLRTLARRLTILLLIGMTILYVAGTLVAALFVRYLLGPQFAAIAWLFPLMGVCLVIALPLIWVHALAAAAGRPVLQLQASVVANLLSIVLLVVLTPLVGLAGAALAFAVGMSMAFPLGLFRLKRAGIV